MLRHGGMHVPRKGDIGNPAKILKQEVAEAEESNESLACPHHS